MFRQIIVFTKSRQLAGVQGLLDASKRHGISMVTLNPFAEINWMVSEKAMVPKSLEGIQLNETLILVRTSGILFDDVDLLLASALQSNGAVLHHSLETLRLLRDKSAQSIWLSENEIPQVPTLLGRGPLCESTLMEWSDGNVSPCFVVKSIRGNKGIGVKKMTFHELTEFWEKTQEAQDQRYLIQPFIDDAKEVRLLFLGDKHYFVEKGTPHDPKEFRRNSTFCSFSPYTSQDTEELLELGLKIKEKLGSKTFAIDFIQVKEAWSVLEINANPSLAAVSEVFPDEDLYLQFLKSF